MALVHVNEQINLTREEFTPLKPSWEIEVRNLWRFCMNYGDCNAIITELSYRRYDVAMWLGGDLVLETRATTMELGQKVVKDWLAANYPL